MPADSCGLSSRYCNEIECSKALPLEFDFYSCKLAALNLVLHRQVSKVAQDRASQPTVWVLTGHKAGDNTQVMTLAEALGWPYEVKRFRYRKYELLTNRLLGVTLAGICKKTSSDLLPPWPDLVITAGRRNEPVARWIQKQSDKKTRLVHIGRPWAPLKLFDLIVTTPQYFLPDQPNVLKNQLPLQTVDGKKADRSK